MEISWASTAGKPSGKGGSPSGNGGGSSGSGGASSPLPSEAPPSAITAHGWASCLTIFNMPVKWRLRWFNIEIWSNEVSWLKCMRLLIFTFLLIPLVFLLACSKSCPSWQSLLKSLEADARTGGFMGKGISCSKGFIVHMKAFYGV